MATRRRMPLLAATVLLVCLGGAAAQLTSAQKAVAVRAAHEAARAAKNAQASQPAPEQQTVAPKPALRPQQPARMPQPPTGPGYTDSNWRWDVWYDDIRPKKDHKFRHDFWYQIPANPRATVLLIHGCAHSGYNWFPQSRACPECRGLPEELSHTLQALRRGYAVIAISSLDRKTGCFNYWEDFLDVKEIVEGWREDNGLDRLPSYGIGVSAGAAFLLKMPRYMRFDGLVSEALGIDPKSGGFDVILEGTKYPPTLFVSMEKDEKQRGFIAQDLKIINRIGGPADKIKVFERRVYPSYFSDRSPYYITPELSRKVWAGLQKVRMIDAEGRVLEDPRYTPRPWLASLQRAVPELGGKTERRFDTAVPEFPEEGERESPDVNLAGVWSLMNLAYAMHEIVSDYTTAAFMWFEGGCQDNLQQMLDWYTVGLPPADAFAAVPLAGAAAANPAAANAANPAKLPARPGAKKAGAVPHSSVQAVRIQQAQLHDAPAQQATTGSVTKKDTGDSTAAPTAAATSDSSSSSSSSSDGASTAGSGSSSSSSGGSSTNVAAIIAGACGGAAAVLLILGLAWCCMRKRWGGGGLQRTATLQAHTAPAPPMLTGASAHVSINTRLAKDRFAELTEVVEQTGSPYSARRRVKTAFQSDSPMKRDTL